MESNGFLAVEDAAPLMESLKKKLLTFGAKHYPLGREDLEDMYQEAFLRLYQTLSRGGRIQRRYASSYVHQTYVSACMDLFREEERRRPGVLSLTDGNYPAPDYRPVELLMEEESKEEMSRFLGKLKPKHEDVLRMSMEGFKDKEIAEALGIPLGTVQSRIFRARKILLYKLTSAGFVKNFDG